MQKIKNRIFDVALLIWLPMLIPYFFIGYAIVDISIIRLSFGVFVIIGIWSQWDKFKVWLTPPWRQE